MVLAPAALAGLSPGSPVAVPPGVPDQGRAWELVSLPDPNWTFFVGSEAVSMDGNRIAYQTGNVLPQAPYNEAFNALDLAVRGGEGWTDSPLQRPVTMASEEEKPIQPLFLTFDSSLENVVWSDEILPRLEGSKEGVRGFYLKSTDGQVTFLAQEEEMLGAPYVLADGGRVVFASKEHLLPADASRTSGRSLYEVVGSSLRLVDADSNGQLLSDCGSTIASQSSISEDGKRIFFGTSPDCSGPPRVYLREGGITTDISAPQCHAICDPEPAVSFVGATPDGSIAFLRSEQKLTDEDTNSHADIYRYNVASGDLTLATGGLGSGVIPSAQPIYTSVDGSHLYFTSEQAKFNSVLYLVDPSGSYLIRGTAPGNPVQISADGRYAVFSTNESLVEEDTDESTDVYRFDGDDGSETLISTGPDGGNGPNDAMTTLSPTINLSESSITPYLSGLAAIPDLSHNPPRVMSADGSRIFFVTAERLVPEDHDEVSDVYEWANGSLGLISAGEESAGASAGSAYLGMSVDGSTVFFSTHATLLPRDRDGGDEDIYAARIGGGFPEPASAGGCEASPCQTPRGRADRPAPSTAKHRPAGLQLARIGAAARRRIAATGWITLLAEVPRKGRLSAQARTRLEHRSQTVASATVQAMRPGPTQLRMRLSKAARNKLASGGSLRLLLALRFSHPDLRRRVSFELGGRR